MYFTFHVRLPLPGTYSSRPNRRVPVARGHPIPGGIMSPDDRAGARRAVS